MKRAVRIWLGLSILVASAWEPSRAVAAIGPGWLAGPGAAGDNTSYAGVIDAPLKDARITRAGGLQLAGWFVDRTASGWAGADDIEIFVGTMGDGGSLLSHALFAQERPDVASAFERPDWLHSGWSAVVSSNALMPGLNVLSRQYVWSLGAASLVQPRSAFYMNTGNPGPQSPRWPHSGTATPQPCDGSASAACAYDYGWLAAEDAYARARSVAGDGAALSPWWLDVEAANSWSDDHVSNAADLKGAVDYLHSVNVSIIGIYALAADWEDIVGATSASAGENGPFAVLPNWRPGAHSTQDAPNWCSQRHRWTRAVRSISEQWI